MVASAISSAAISARALSRDAGAVSRSVSARRAAATGHSRPPVARSSNAPGNDGPSDGLGKMRSRRPPGC